MTSPPKALTVAQEQRLVAYLDESFLGLTRNFNKRLEPESPLSSLADYLAEAHRLLSLILQIPPIDPSTSLRTAYLLRLTNDSLIAIVGYPAPPKPDVFTLVLEFLDSLDQAFLQSQVWDPIKDIGIDLVLPTDEANSTTKKSSPLSTTERAGARSALLGGVANLQAWMSVPQEPSSPGSPTPSSDLHEQLERMALDLDRGDSHAFHDMFFSGALAELGGFGHGGETEDIEMCLPPMSSIMAEGPVLQPDTPELS